MLYLKITGDVYTSVYMPSLHDTVVLLDCYYSESSQRELRTKCKFAADRMQAYDSLSAHFKATLPTDAFYSMSGGTPSADRQNLVDKFNKSAEHKPCVFLMSINACGIGINLHTATRVVLTSPQYNPMWEAQAAARAHRIGQTKPVTVYRLAFDGAYDQKVQVRGCS